MIMLLSASGMNPLRNRQRYELQLEIMTKIDFSYMLIL